MGNMQLAANVLDPKGLLSALQALRNGDLSVRLPADVYGVDGEIAQAFNAAVDQLNGFASEVSRVAREVGSEGKLGGQAAVPGVAGLWRDLTDNVNQLAANLTAQVRAIAEVATAVTKGDLTRSISVEARGEVAALKDAINEMIGNLKDTTRKNNDQDWLKTHIANLTRMLQGHRDLATVSKLVLSELAPLVEAQQGVFYIQRKHRSDYRLELLASYASRPSRHLPKSLRIGEGLVGQCASDRKRIVLEDVPDDYVPIASALHTARPVNVVILPVVFEGEVKAVIELASLRRFSEIHLSFLDQLTESIGVVINTIEANMRTEALLGQSQLLTRELQNQQLELKETNDQLQQQAHNLQTSERLLKAKQEELQRSNEQLEEKAMLLSEQMTQIEWKNREVEQARSALEEKAEQLALSSRYKSVFLANMSHELRTPLNSLLILAKLLSDNAMHNLSPQQIEYARTIHAAGNDLLAMINDILDLAKIESGTVTLDIGPERFSELQDYVERTFRQLAQGKGLGFTVNADPNLPPHTVTDGKRLQQILKNLLSNAIKFTERGEVALDIFPAKDGWTLGHKELDDAEMVIAFAVRDTGIGIAESSRQIIFEAFQQADGATSRRFGGTGLGLSISRELTRLLDGEIRVESTPGDGSTFTLYVPLIHERRSAGLSPPAPPATAAVEPDTGQRPADPLEGVLAEATLVLHQAIAELPPGAPHGPGERLAGIRSTYTELAGRKILIVDDDIRNIFALTGAIEEYGLVVLNAESALEGIELLKGEPNTDAVLMDIMMPEIDGYQAIGMIRAMEQFRHLPIIAVTAKAMKGDREKCIEAGATDYVAKPVDVEQLMAVLRSRLA